MRRCGERSPDHQPGGKTFPRSPISLQICFRFFWIRLSGAAVTLIFCVFGLTEIAFFSMGFYGAMLIFGIWSYRDYLFLRIMGGIRLGTSFENVLRECSSGMFFAILRRWRHRGRTMTCQENGRFLTPRSWPRTSQDTRRISDVNDVCNVL